MLTERLIVFPLARDEEMPRPLDCLLLICDATVIFLGVLESVLLLLDIFCTICFFADLDLDAFACNCAFVKDPLLALLAGDLDLILAFRRAFSSARVLF